MTVQVTTSPPGTTATYTYNFSTGAPQVPAGPGLLEFRDVQPDGSLGPVWDADDLTVVESTDAGLRVRFPDGTEIILVGPPQQLAGIMEGVAPAAGAETGSGPEAGGSSQAFNAFVEGPGGSVFGVGPGGTTLLLGAAGSGSLGTEDPNLLLASAGLGSLAPEDPNLLLSVTGPTIPTLVPATPLPLPLFTPGADEVDLSGPVSAFLPAFGTPFASDGNISNALAEDDTVQLANAGEPNNLTTLFNAGNANVPSPAFFGGDGSDTVNGGNGPDLIYGDDVGTADGGADILNGNGGSDILYGGTGDDRLFGGGGGGDVLNGGAGNDFVDVGGGNLNRERIVISDREDGIDTIVNFDNFGQFSETLDLDDLFDDLAGDLGVVLDTAARIGRLSLVGAGVNTTNVSIDQSAAGDGSDMIQIAVIQSTFATVFIGVGSGASVFDDIAVGA